MSNVLIGNNAGLPNVTGNVQVGSTNYWGGDPEGAFYKSPNAISYMNNFASSAGRIGYTLFDAARGETKTDGTRKTSTEYKVFGKSDTVLPQSLASRYWRRTS